MGSTLPDTSSKSFNTHWNYKYLSGDIIIKISLAHMHMPACITQKSYLFFASDKQGGKLSNIYNSFVYKYCNCCRQKLINCLKDFKLGFWSSLKLFIFWDPSKMYHFWLWVIKQISFNWNWNIFLIELYIQLYNVFVYVLFNMDTVGRNKRI